MTLRVLHYSDIENAYDDPERVGRLAGTIEARRDDRTVVVGTGDDTAPGVLALRTEGRQSLDFFRAVEPEFETFGNHDFDFGPEPLREIVAESPQRWLTANVYEGGDGGADGESDSADSKSTAATHENAIADSNSATADLRFTDADPTAVVERGDERVGFVGVTDPQTPEIAVGAADLTFTDPVVAVRDALARLRERADYVVVLAHLLEDEEREIAALDGVDAILGGHVHSERRERVDGTLLLRPGANGRVVWEVELGGDGERTATATRREVADGPLDEDVADALRERMAATGLTEVVATADQPIVRELEHRFGGECRVGNLVTDAYRWATGADVGFVQNGGLRDGPPLAGEVTVADLVGVSPFGGELQTVVVSGAELRELASDAFRPDHGEGRLWWGHFSGLAITYDESERRVLEVRRDGDPVDPEREFTLATNAFVVQHGSGPITPDRVVDTWGIQYDAIVEYAREEELEVELDGRLRSV